MREETAKADVLHNKLCNNELQIRDPLIAVLVDSRDEKNIRSYGCRHI